MKFSWGTGIFMLYAGFAALTIGLVVFAMTKKVDLVTDNYYDKELKYEQQIQRQKNLELLDGKIDVELSAGSVKIKFPASINKDSVNGTFNFYRASDSGKDIVLPIALDEKNEQLISVSKFDAGMWKLQIAWSFDNKEYYDERSLFIQ